MVRFHGSFNSHIFKYNELELDPNRLKKMIPSLGGPDEVPGHLKGEVLREMLIYNANCLLSITQ